MTVQNSHSLILLLKERRTSQSSVNIALTPYKFFLILLLDSEIQLAVQAS